ncbi:hypothetical protein BKY29_01640 [Weissella confusa]|nr:hypothetical protein BKY29_01640 [Weissella confusa]
MAKPVGVLLRGLPLSSTEGKGVRGKAVDSTRHYFDTPRLAGQKKPPATPAVRTDTHHYLHLTKRKEVFNPISKM